MRSAYRGSLGHMCGNNDLWVFVKIHATYTQSGWTRSELAMHITRPVSRMGIIVRGRFSAGVVLQGDILREDASQPGVIGLCRSN